MILYLRFFYGLLLSCIITVTDTQLTNVVGLSRDQPALQADHFDGVKTDLENVIDESKQGGQGERCHEYGGETELDHWRGGTISKIER